MPTIEPLAKVTLGSCVLLLLAGLGLVLYGNRLPPERTFKGSVRNLLPKPENTSGWKVDYPPMADSLVMEAKLDEELNYDDAVYAIYTNGDQRLSVYIAYWAPGKMQHRLIAIHTPDVCWVAAGWRVREARFAEIEARGWPLGNSGRPGAGLPGQDSSPLSAVLASVSRLMAPVEDTQPKFELLPPTLPPAEYRAMELNGNVEHVIFWHLLDGRPMSYGTRGLPPWHAPFTDLFKHRLNQKPEQFFIRLSSNTLIGKYLLREDLAAATR